MAYRPTPGTEAKKLAMRQRLLAAASELFISQGYDGTSLQQIVKAAETSIGNCYFYFPNKEAILFAIGDQLRSDLAFEIDSAIENVEAGLSQFSVAIYVGVIATLDRADLARVVFIDSALPSVRNLTMEMFAGRARMAFSENPQLFEGWPEASPDLAAAAWHGSVYYVLEGVLSGRIQDPPNTVARFAVRWNLQSLGLPFPIVSEALEALPHLIANSR